MRILIINGPNLNLLGQREPHLYGHETYQDLETRLQDKAAALNVEVDIRQTNFEGIILDLCHYAQQEAFDGIILNAAALTHYSYALYDAIQAIDVPVVEVHLTDPKTRKEHWRHTSVIEKACIRTFSGQHFKSYEQALDFLHTNLKTAHKA